MDWGSLLWSHKAMAGHCSSARALGHHATSSPHLEVAKPQDCCKWAPCRLPPPPRARVGRGAEGEKVTRDYLGPESGSTSLEVHQVTAVSSYSHGCVSLRPTSCDHLFGSWAAKPPVFTPQPLGSVLVTLPGEGLDPVSHLLLFGASFGWDVKLALCHARAGCVH